ncbi:MAG: BamA/TamA family outer membrane protein, partial [Rhodothermaceae bacterium]|nr:BamA/TamA family outer membrane protein [Rhodothermaceae bacterium]
MLRRLSVVLALAAALLVADPAAAQYFGFGKNRVQYGAHDWRYIQSEHFDIYFYEREGTAPGGRILADFTARAAEDAYEQVADLFNYEISERIPLLVYQGHNDFAVTNAVQLPVYAEGIGGVTELFKNRIAVPFTGDWRDYRRVVHHELVHAVINDIFYGGSIQSILQNNLRLQIPLWFNEGLAEYSALGWDTQSDMYLRDAILNDYLADIPRLSGFFAYRGGQGVWDFIAEEYGREKVSEILERVRLTHSVPGAFREATGLSLRELSDRWKEALKIEYFPEVAAREDLDVVARPLVTEERGGGYYNTSPAISPQGDQVAYVTATDGLFDVYVVAASGTERPQKLIDGQDNTQFESLRVLSPGLAWDPSGTRLAVAVKSGPSDAVAVYDVTRRRAEHFRVPNVDGIHSVAWSPDSTRIAFSGASGAQSDIFVLDLATGTATNVTGDLFSDHEPAWSPDSRSLVFHSDRADQLQLKQATAAATGPGGFDPLAHDFSQYDLYRLDLEAPDRVERLTFNESWDETNAEFGGPDRLLFVSDRNGIWNLYEKDLATGDELPLTDLQTGVIQASLSADGSRAALVALNEGTPSIYLLRDPFDRTDEMPDTLVPNVWAQRVSGGADGLAPPLQIASAATRQRNPLLRDAADGTPFDEDPMRRREDAAEPPLIVDGLFGVPADSLSALGTNGTHGTNGRDLNLDSLLTTPGTVIYQGVPEEVLLASADTTVVDFRDYSFSEAFEEAARERFETVEDRFSPPENVNPDGSFRVRRYRLRFTPDLVYAAGAYDTVFGVQSVTQMLFSDMLGNHRLSLATNLVLDLRNSDYLLGYQYLARRTDYAFQGFHLARELPDFQRGTVFRYRNYGAIVGASYPLDKFRRVDGSLSLLGVSLTDLSDLGAQPSSRQFVYPRVAFTSDHTVPGFLGPRSGRRWAVSLAGSPGPDINFVTALADARQYVPLGRFYAVALRVSGGASIGPDPQRFYAAGVQNWLNASFRSLPIEDPDDFVFATPILPLRGYDFNEAIGDRFALVNAEFRAPLIAALLPGPIPILPLYNIQVVGFADAGLIAEGDFNLRRTNAEGKEVFDDLYLGAGVGLRTILLGYPVRLDWAWPY